MPKVSMWCFWESSLAVKKQSVEVDNHYMSVSVTMQYYYYMVLLAQIDL